MSNWRHSRKGFRPLALQVPKREARTILLSLPCWERVPQQVDPTSLFESGVVVMGRVEITHQNPFEGLAQDLIHHRPGPGAGRTAPRVC